MDKVFVGLPVYGGMPYEFVKSLLELYASPPCHLDIKFMPGDSLVSRARNSLSSAFLKTDCTHLLFIDCDLEFSGEQIARLLEHDKDIVAGFYPKKKDGPHIEWVCNSLTNDPLPSGLQEVRYMGTGFMLIKRCVFERMIERYGGEIAFSPDHSPNTTEWDFWAVGPYKYPDGKVRHLSEDWYFCQRWIDMGGQIYGDTRVILKHIGHASYPLQHQQADLMKKGG